MSELNKKRIKVSTLYWGIVVLIGIILTLSWIVFWKEIAWTNDCYVHGNQIYLTPLHSGFVTRINTDDTFLVKQNEILVELDRTDAIIRFDQLSANLGQTVRQVCEMYHDVFAYQSQIEIAKANFIKNAQDFEHRLRVLSAQAVSLEDYEHAVAGLRESFFELKKIEILYEKALSLVQGVSILSHPLIMEASDKVRDAWVYLRRCHLYAPSDGIAAQRLIQVGMFVKEGDPLLSVIPMDQIWVNANFKETQLTRMKIGQRATIKVDLYGRDVKFHGRVVGLPAVAGNVTGLLPPQNLSGNWIKIVQRLPVRIELDANEIKKHPLRLGLSCEATVHLDDQSGLLVPTSTKGSPVYSTSTYDHEEEGDRKYIDQVISTNLDPTLEKYKESVLNLPTYKMTIPSLIQEALLASPTAPLKPPFPDGLIHDE